MRLSKRVGRVRPNQRRDLRLTRADSVPKVAFDDLEVRDLGPDPGAFRVDTRNTLACRRVLDETLAVPDENACIKLVVENTGAA